jgi:hypothetical protein
MLGGATSSANWVTAIITTLRASKNTPSAVGVKG